MILDDGVVVSDIKIKSSQSMQDMMQDIEVMKAELECKMMEIDVDKDRIKKNRYLKDIRFELFSAQQEITRRGLEVLISLKKIKLPYSIESIVECKIENLLHSLQPGDISDR